MDCLEQARALYGEYYRPGNNLSQEKQASISAAISKLIRTSLLQQGGNASFRYLPFCRVIQRTVGANRFHGERAAAAFLTLERYLVLLAQQPWKREFWVMKLYGGYFCTKVRAHLEGAEEVLQLIGFVPEQVAEGGASTAATADLCLCLVLQEAPDSEVALNVAFDCQVAALECQCIGEYHSKMRCVGLDLADAMNVLLSGATSTPHLMASSPSVPGGGGGGAAAGGGGGELGGRSGGGGVGGGGLLGSGNLKVSYNPGSVLLDAALWAGCGQGSVSTTLSASSSSSSPSSMRSHTVLASGGMGMGVVTSAGAGVKAMHQVIGVQPSSSFSSSHHASVSSAGSGGGGGGGVTHQVIGVSATHHHHHHHHHPRSVTVMGVGGGSGGGGGPFQMTGGTVSSAGATPMEPYNTAASVSSPPTPAAAARGSGTAVGAGHSVLHVTGVPASTHPAPAPAPASHHASAELLSRKDYTPAPLLQPAVAPHHLSSSSSPSSTPPSSTSALPHSEPAFTSCPVMDSRMPAVGMTTILPPPSQHQPSTVGVGVGGESGRAPFMMTSLSHHSPSVAYQLPGSRGSYASSAYGSGSASVLSGGSSACTGSSGYCSATSSSSPSHHHHEYANLPIKPLPLPPPAVAPAPPLSRPSRAPSQKPQFPFIQEDEVGPYGAPFPEATHEEHLRESLRNLQVSHPDKTQKRPLTKNLSSQLTGGPQQSDHRMMVTTGSEGHTPVTYDDWRWFRGDPSKGLASPCKTSGEGGGGGGGGGMKSHPASGNIHPSAVLRSAVSSSSSSGGHLGTAAPRLPTAATADAMSTSSKMDPRPLPPHLGSTAGEVGGGGVLSPLSQQQQEPWTWKASVTPNPVYYPPGLMAHPEDLYCNLPPTNLAPPPPPPSYPMPLAPLSSQRATNITATTTTTATIAAHPPHPSPPPPAPAPVTRWEERVVVGPGAQTGASWRAAPSPPSPPSSPIYNNLDHRTPAMKVLNASPDVDRPLFEAVVKKQDFAVASPSKGRAGGAGSMGSASHYANLVDLPVAGSGRSGGQHGQHGPYSVDGVGAWACGTCTMENQAGSSVCRMCGRSRGSGSPGGGGGRGGLRGVEVAPPFSVAGESRRVCPSCTFENPPGCRSCEVCEVLLSQDVHTYV